jgi:hypothetical protein
MIDRRQLLGLAVAGSAGLALPRELAATPPPRVDDWLDALARRPHKAFLDIRAYATDSAPFHKVTNLRAALTQAYAIRAEDIGIAFGGSGSSIAYLLGVDIWTEYRVGAKVAGSARTPAEAESLRSEPARWVTSHLEEVKRMLADGTRVLACRNSIGRWAREFAATSGEAAETVNAKLIAGLHPGVEPVPAMVAAAVLAQGRGLSYVAIG